MVKGSARVQTNTNKVPFDDRPEAQRELLTIKPETMIRESDGHVRKT